MKGETIRFPFLTKTEGRKWGSTPIGFPSLLVCLASEVLQYYFQPGGGGCGGYDALSPVARSGDCDDCWFFLVCGGELGSPACLVYVDC